VTPDPNLVNGFDGVGLYDTVLTPDRNEFTLIGTVNLREVALVVAIHRDDVYVVGPNGGGWTQCGLLKVVYDKKAPK